MGMGDPTEPRGSRAARRDRLARCNQWTRIGRAHIVIFPSRRVEREWCLRLEYEAGPHGS